MKTVDQLIAEVPAFTGMAPEHLELIAGCASIAHFHAGEYLFREGGPADAFYALRRGSIALEIYVPGRSAMVIDTLHEGELVGWSWLFSPYKWDMDARAVELIRAIAFDAACLRGKADADPVLGYELMRRFAPLIVDRLQSTRLRLLDVYGSAVTRG